MAHVILKAGKEKSLKNRHPWVFSGAIQSVVGAADLGDQLEIFSSKNEFLACGYFNPHSQIRMRIFSWEKDFRLDYRSLKHSIAKSIGRRDHINRKETNAIRLVAHESDLIPGLVIDQYADWISFQLLTAGIEQHRSDIIKIIDELLSPVGIVERSDEAIRKKEGLPLRKELIKGEIPAKGIEVLENGMALLVDIWDGHKTGFYIDQRDNRAIIRQFANGRRVLNCFSYTGGFSIAAAQGGAMEVINVDESLSALEIAEANGINSGCKTKFEYIQGDVFQYIRHLKDTGEKFDMVILDPPKFVSNQRNLDRACRGYKDLNLIAWQILKDDGLLATFSCSGLMSRDLFQKVVFGSTIDAGCEAQIVKHLFQSEDHPTRLSFPESLYLKGFLLRKPSI